ncbi:hypothetical protein ACJMK2_030886 [Sinanodonta woodiana]|uniref:FGF n=1 Tax=Sinanodonta woodiana TaxID=1069815 RepID=A0ABD3X145_SINWO
MSLAPNSASVIPNLTPVAPASHWNNPVPDFFKKIDEGRSFRLHNMNNRFLEMHDDKVRSSSKPTKYGILTIITVMINISKHANLTTFSSKPKLDLGELSKRDGIEITNGVVIRGNVTGNFLCMDNKSELYPSKNKTDECEFYEEFVQPNNSNLYYRKFNNSKWYIGINKDNSIRCGNVSRANQKGSMFFKVAVNKSEPDQSGDILEDDNSPCCAKDRCDKRTSHKAKKRKHRHRNNKKDRGEISEGREKEGKRNKCRTYKKWCRIKRQKFFSLKLKDLKKYYKRCLKEFSKSQQTDCTS